MMQSPRRLRQSMKPAPRMHFGALFLGASLLCTIALLLVGCSPVKTLKKTTGRMVRDFRSDDGDLKKIVGLMPFEISPSVAGLAIGRNFHQMLNQALKQRCSELILVSAGDPQYADFTGQRPRKASGHVDNFQLATQGKALGFNAFVSGAFLAVGQRNREQGFWLWKDVSKFYDIQLTVTVLDTETGAKLLDEVYQKEVEVGPTADEGAESPEGPDSAALQKHFNELLTDMSDDICDVLIRHGWRGYITDVINERIVVASGQRAGIAVGDRFEVFGVDKIIRSESDDRYYVPGLKTGEITITAVFPHSADAVAAAESVIAAGSSIRPKP